MDVSTRSHRPAPFNDVTPPQRYSTNLLSYDTHRAARAPRSPKIPAGSVFSSLLLIDLWVCGDNEPGRGRESLNNSVASACIYSYGQHPTNGSSFGPTYHRPSYRRHFSRGLFVIRFLLVSINNGRRMYQLIRGRWAHSSTFLEHAEHVRVTSIPEVIPVEKKMNGLGASNPGVQTDSK